MNRTMTTKALTITGIAAVAGLSALLGPTTAHAGTPGVYAKAGVIYDTNGTRLTEDEVNSQPRLSPDRTKIAYVHNGTVWVMNRQGGDKHQVSDRIGSRPVWNAGSSLITYTATSCTGEPGTFQTGTEGGAASAPLLPAECVDRPAPQTGFITGIVDEDQTGE
jgi:hypothetical protein